MSNSHPEDLQRAFYARTAESYDNAHAPETGEYDIAFRLIAGVAGAMGARRIVDVGAGTGIGVLRLRQLLPEVEIFGLEPVAELVAQGRKKGLGEDLLRIGDGRALSLADGEVDFAVATGVLHHVRHPREVIKEMVRVSRVGIFISDINRYAQGSLASRFFKLVLRGLGLWPVFYFLRTRGKGYNESRGDGIFFSYSVYDDMPFLSSWGDHTLVVPLDPDPRLKATWLGRLGTLFTTSHLLVGAFRHTAKQVKS